MFTTSYDLLIYWSMGYGEDEGKAYGSLKDLFWSGKRCEFDPNDASLFPGITPVYFLHGAMHLIVDDSGVTRKLRRGVSPVLDQFGMLQKDDPRARPLLITEGSSADKLGAMENNVYLAHALRRLRRCHRPLVVFGSSLGEQDQHLVEAINEHPERPVAVTMRRSGGRPARKREQAVIASRLLTERLYFYDAATHPLGAPNLRATLDTESHVA